MKANRTVSFISMKKSETVFTNLILARCIMSPVKQNGNPSKKSQNLFLQTIFSGVLQYVHRQQQKGGQANDNLDCINRCQRSNRHGRQNHHRVGEQGSEQVNLFRRPINIWKGYLQTFPENVLKC